MDFSKLSAGKDAPRDVYAVIEIPMGSSIKYELDKESGAIMVDRFLFTPMAYPANYGAIPATIGGDGDPVDILVVAEQPVVPGSVIRCRPIGVLKMEDESGVDEKIVAVPHDKLTLAYKDVKELSDLPEITVAKMRHFFERYKDLEPGKWIKVTGQGDAAEAMQLIEEGMKRA